MATATLRMELFPHSLPESLAFYTNIMGFTVLRHEPDSPSPDCTTGYAHVRRSAIQLGLATKQPHEFPSAARDPADRAQYRKWPVGVEIVIEVDDVHAERERVVKAGWELESDLKLQEWGLIDFRLRDPDGYYLRVSERGGHDGLGSEEARRKVEEIEA